MQLKPWWDKYDHLWITPKRFDTQEILKKEKVYWAYFPENRNIINAFRNMFLAINIFLKEKPNVIFSTGAGIAPPFFLIGKILGIKLIYLETASYINIPTLTGRLVYRFADIFLVQHPSSKKFFPKALYKGSLL